MILTKDQYKDALIVKDCSKRVIFDEEVSNANYVAICLKPTDVLKKMVDFHVENEFIICYGSDGLDDFITYLIVDMGSPDVFIDLEDKDAAMEMIDRQVEEMYGMTLQGILTEDLDDEY